MGSSRLFTDRSKSRGPIVVRRYISFEIEEGDAPAIIGATGSGNTTLPHLISGLIALDFGLVRQRMRDGMRGFGLSRQYSSAVGIRGPILPGLASFLQTNRRPRPGCYGDRTSFPWCSRLVLQGSAHIRVLERRILTIPAAAGTV